MEYARYISFIRIFWR